MNFEIEVTKDINSSRNAINLVHSFTPFKSGIYITKEGRRINAKSILGLLSASIVKGDHIEVEVFDDNDCVEVKNILTKFFEEEWDKCLIIG